MQIVKPFLDPKTFRKVNFVYTKNPESQKILGELFEEDAVKSILEDPNDFNFEEYTKLMQEDDLKSALYWKGAGESKAEQAEVQNGTAPEVVDSKIEEAPAEAPAAEVPLAETPRELLVAESQDTDGQKAPKGEPPVVESEVASAPVSESPTAEAPVAEPQVAEAPKVEAPVVAPVS